MCCRWYGATASKVRDESGQALPLALGGCLVLIAAAIALVAIAGAVTGKGRAQRAADLAAISAVRSMRDDLPRLLSPPRLPNGAPNPSHLEKSTYLDRAREAAFAAGRHNEVDTSHLRIAFPDRSSFAPVRAKATVMAPVAQPSSRTRSPGAIQRAMRPAEALVYQRSKSTSGS
jgi:hypothetical protein